MKQFFSWMGRRIINGIVTGIFLILTVASITYALNYNWADPTSIRNRVAGNPLSSVGWNLLVGNVDNLNERLSTAEGSGGITPAGAIMAFNLSTCPSGWSEADGTNGRPDLRGEFIRGLDDGRGIDTGRTLASGQVDILKSHHHGLSLDGNAWTAFLRFGSPNATWWMSDSGGNHFFTDSTGGSETRPRNVAFLYCIKN